MNSRIQRNILALWILGISLSLTGPLCATILIVNSLGDKPQAQGNTPSVHIAPPIATTIDEGWNVDLNDKSWKGRSR